MKMAPSKSKRKAGGQAATNGHAVRAVVQILFATGKAYTIETLQERLRERFCEKNFLHPSSWIAWSHERRNKHLPILSPLREILMEPRADSTGWVTLVRDPAKGLVTSRTGPGVSETLAYYPLAGDPTSTLHRTGRLWKRTPTLTSKGPEFYDYNALGQVTAQWGRGTYPPG